MPFGYSALYGGVPGGQPELGRVPKANVGPLPVPDALSDPQVPVLSDSLPAACQAATNAGTRQGSSVAIFGAAPAGCMSAACARMPGKGRLAPEAIISHRLKPADAAEGWRIFERREDDCRKLVLTP